MRPEGNHGPIRGFLFARSSTGSSRMASLGPRTRLQFRNSTSSRFTYTSASGAVGPKPLPKLPSAAPSIFLFINSFWLMSLLPFFFLCVCVFFCFFFVCCCCCFPFLYECVYVLVSLSLYIYVSLFFYFFFAPRKTN